MFKKIFGSEMPWHQYKELPELVGQDTVLTAGNEGTQLCNVLQLSAQHRKAAFFSSSLFFFPGSHHSWLGSWTWDALGCKRRELLVMPCKELRDRIYGVPSSSEISGCLIF